MPRTKRAQSKKPVEDVYTSTTKRNIVMKAIDDEEANMLALLEREKEERLKCLKLHYIASKTDIKTSMLKASVKDIKSGEFNSLSETTVVLSDLTNTLNSTKSSRNINTIKKTVSQTRSRNRSVTECTKNPVKRSISVGCDDEGYRTAESTSSTTSGNTRLSRSKTRDHKKRISRSVSSHSKTNVYKTPASKQPQVCTGPITPKCKPNTPQIFMRRPMIGEMAWSNQGSPLLIGTNATEHMANVNIPLDNGIVSLLPQRGIRVSEIPQVNTETMEELKVLRDNLIKLCSVASK
ncbi:uncharacterized protein LOC143199009 isoform X1 [Rhynchophorus ferrugineus]|uniref:uncharacterized protein LOC143199009 isoform X1 n=1 Tax=Rhynchophorus ferrugineus TaxID=354439 RepID=UPI003FCD0E52